MQDSAKHHYCLMDVIYFLRSICGKKKQLFCIQKPCWEIGQSLEVSAWGGKLIKNFETFWMSNHEAIILNSAIYLFIYLFIYNNFICNNQYKKAAIREELNPHVRWPPKNIYKAIKEI